MVSIMNILTGMCEIVYQVLAVYAGQKTCTKHKVETLREDVTSEISLEMSPEKSERLCEFDQ